MERRNMNGKILTGEPVYRNPDYCVVLPNGARIPDYKTYASESADDLGFDKGHKEPNGSHTMEIVLPKNTIIIRYGTPFGHYSAPKGTKYEELALPYIEESCEYNEYRVIDDIKVQCIVNRGRVAPNFHQMGGGVQYYHLQTILQEIKDKKLERIEYSG